MEAAGDTTVEAIGFEDLLGILPDGGFSGDPQEAFAVADPAPAFIPPTLRVLDDPSDAAVTLISARGAMGKSTLARQLSAEKGVPLWALNDDVAVSADAFDARLGRFLRTAEPQAELAANGDAFVVIDSLDEARMRVSGTSWEQFVASLSRAATGGHRLVLLGRERVLDELWLALNEGGITSRWFEISHFDADQRKRYVDERVAAAGYAVDSEPYLAARDAVLVALEGTVSGLLADSFVGYAPVLDAVAALLAGENHKAVENTFSTSDLDGERVGVLLQVLDSLLEREQGKVRPLANDLGLGEDDVYRPDEQLQWIVSALFGGPQPSLEWCPPAVRADYAKLISPFVEDHPFRSEKQWASPVFSAFVCSRLFDDNAVKPHLQGIGSSTGLLFEFVSHDDKEPIVNEWQFAALHSSLLAAEWHEVEAVVSLREAAGSNGEPPDSASGQLVLMAGDIAARVMPLDLALDQKGVLQLLGPTAYLSADFPGKVEVRPEGASITMGPDCFIRCESLALSGETVQINRRADDTSGQSEVPSVTLEVAGRFECAAALTGHTPQDAFELHVNPDEVLVYPWVQYRHPLETTPTRPNDRAERFLNMLMNTMRRHGKQNWGVYRKKLEGRQSIKGSELDDVLSRMESLGVISRQGEMVLLRSEWEDARFDGKAREGRPSLDDKMETWRPVFEAIEEVLEA